MLQQILADMYVDPDVLEALNEEQKKILFFKMREEQVRRWKEREEKEGNEGIKKEKLRLKKGTCKSVSWLLGHDGEVHVCIIGESDELESPKHILSELRNNRVANFNHINRTKAEAAKSHQTKENRSDTGIQLLLQKPKELEDSGTVTNDLKQDSGSDQSADETKCQTDDSDTGSAEDDTGLYRSHLSNRSTTVADTLREIKLQRAMNERLSIKEKTRPQDTVPPEKGLLGAEHGSMTYGSRVAQLRKTFNSSNAPCAKPPIPCKPAHLLTPPTVR